MPPIRSSTFKRRVLLTSSITLNREIMSPYSYYIKKGLVCVAIIIYTSPFFTQQEQGLIISPLRVMENVSSTQHSKTEDLIKGIRDNKSY